MKGMPLNGYTRVRPSSAPRTISEDRSSKVRVSSSKIELLISCNDLPRLDTFSSSDAVCVLYVRQFGSWKELRRTECIVNSLKPKFTETFLLDNTEVEDQTLRFSVFNMENMTSKELHQHQEIGSIDVMTSELLNRETVFTADLRGSEKTAGTITISAERVDENSQKETVNLCIAAQKLSTKKLFGKFACFFELSRSLPNSISHPIYRSEIVTRNTEPRWRPFQISLQKLCNGDRCCIVTISVWNFKNKGDHELIGECQCSADKLLKSNGAFKALPIYKIESGRTFSISKKGSSPSSGTVQILQSYINEQFCLLDYVKGGCSIKFMAAVDFSLSNGHPLEEDSLHFVGKNKSNVYADALYEVGSLLAYYELSQHLPLYAFGGGLDEGCDEEECFSVSQSGYEQQSQQNGIQTLVEAYKDVLPRIKPNGPTRFTPILRRFTEGIEEVTEEGEQCFTFCLILTDGICNDEAEFISELIKLAHLPFSIVIVGVGLLDCLSLQVLADKVKKKAKRPMVYFIPFRQPDTGMYDSRQVRWTYAQLSKDTVEYFKSKSIKPGKEQTPPRPQSAWGERSFGAALFEPCKEGLDSNLNSIMNRASFCPTCGSSGPVSF